MTGICTPTTASGITLKKDQRTYQHVPVNDKAGHGSSIFCMGRHHNRALSTWQICESHPDFEGAVGDAPPITTFGTGAWKARPGLRSELIVEVDHISWTQSRRATQRPVHVQLRAVYSCFRSHADTCADVPVARSAATWAPYHAGTGGLEKTEGGRGRECECEARAAWASCAV